MWRNKSKICFAVRLRSLQVLKESGDDLLPLPTAEDEQGMTELQVEEAGMQRIWRRQGGRGCRGKCVLV
jgi:hypothetical protein